MVKGAIHPNGSNFRRVARLDIVDRMRQLVNQNLYERPRWLETCERTPPLESKNFEIQDKMVRNPYPQMIRHVLKKHPDLRFIDCFVDGNDWSTGNDTYRPDHPVMKFVARQKHIMNVEGLSKRDAFAKTEAEFLAKRLEREKYQKMRMALMQEFFGENHVKPLFTSGAAIHAQATAEIELAELRRIKEKLIKERQKLHKKPSNRLKMRQKLPEHIRAELQRTVEQEERKAPLIVESSPASSSRSAKTGFRSSTADTSPVSAEHDTAAVPHPADEGVTATPDKLEAATSVDPSERVAEVAERRKSSQLQREKQKAGRKADRLFNERSREDT